MAETDERPPQVHYLRARLQMLSDEADVALRIECESAEGAWCRLTCDEGCEEYGPDHPHQLVSTDGYCNAVEWIESGDSLHLSYSGDPTGSYPLHDGMAVDVVWEGDYYSWRLPACCTVTTGSISVSGSEPRHSANSTEGTS